MKYQVIANGVLMTPSTGCTATKALRTVCGILQGCRPDSQNEPLDVKVLYQNAAGEWKLETYFKI